jgi:hypothetical protein
MWSNVESSLGHRVLTKRGRIILNKDRMVKMTKRGVLHQRAKENNELVYHDKPVGNTRIHRIMNSFLCMKTQTMRAKKPNTNHFKHQ